MLATCLVIESTSPMKNPLPSDQKTASLASGSSMDLSETLSKTETVQQSVPLPEELASACSRCGQVRRLAWHNYGVRTTFPAGPRGMGWSCLECVTAACAE